MSEFIDLDSMLDMPVSDMKPHPMSKLSAGKKTAYLGGLVFGCFVDDGILDDSEKSKIVSTAVSMGMRPADVEDAIETVRSLEGNEKIDYIFDVARILDSRNNCFRKDFLFFLFDLICVMTADGFMTDDGETLVEELMRLSNVAKAGRDLVRARIPVLSCNGEWTYGQFSSDISMDNEFDAWFIPSDFWLAQKQYKTEFKREKKDVEAGAKDFKEGCEHEARGEDVKAYFSYKYSAENGCIRGMYRYGCCCYDGYGSGLKNGKKAFWWFMKAAKLGDAEAQSRVGAHYIRGDIVEKDFRKAFTWISYAARQGLPKGISNLGACYRDGIGVYKDEGKAFSLFLKAAKADYPLAQVLVGESYMKGQGTRQDYSFARFWLEKAASSSDGNVSVRARKVLEKIEGTLDEA